MAPYIELSELANLLATRAAAGARVVAALAGAPGSGKSTQAENLAAMLDARQAGSAVVLPMDGYHYDDTYLVPAGLRPRKGAPDTFDVGGLFHTLKRIRARDEPFVAVPVFDRDLEIARAGARMIAADVPIVIVEGNYLLLGQEPWSRLRPLFDIAVLLDVPAHILGDRLAGRWRRYKLTPEEIAAKLEDNDLPNGRLVMAESRGEDYRLANG
ncbi:nucleoside/nucleotide kinase family protein [Defluviimonas sp. SAOS-178_SWC]|uniref:nucleoside/nucleotide kinase family protein n=1 Tax=Defluviimonas sp. SAOS-178_SWC TaxID=3121287 RepID=UPI00322161EB